MEASHNWAHEEFGRVGFWDRRLKERLYRIAEDFHGCPQGSVPEACGSKAGAMGAYRFFANGKVTMDVLLTGHVEATIQRIRQHPIVLVPQDTTTLNYTTHPMQQGLGPIGTRRVLGEGPMYPKARIDAVTDGISAVAMTQSSPSTSGCPTSSALRTRRRSRAP